MKNIIILTATKNSNYILGENLLKLINQKQYKVVLSCLEDFDLPLFLASDYEKFKQNVGG